MVKVALINPGKNIELGTQEPLNLGYIASFLERENIEVSIIDEIAGDDIKKKIISTNPEIVGITATTPIVTRGYEIAKMCRDMGILTIMGGVHASILPDEALKYADIVVKGEGELAMRDIVFDSIKGGIISRPYIKNLDDVPPPSRHLLNMNYYMHTKDRVPSAHLNFVPPKSKVASIITSRGCPYNCIYCHNSWKDIPFRSHSIERVINEIQHLVEDYGINAIFFMDDNLFANKPRLRKMCSLIKDKFDIIWSCNARADNVDLETLKAAKEAGCVQISFGFESGSQRILNLLKNKAVTVEQNKKAVELCKSAGLEVYGTFMIGNPTETIEDVRLTQQFIRENDIDSIGVPITTPFPGTKLWDWCKENNLIPASINWDDFDMNKFSILACNTMTRNEIEKLRIETYSIFYKRRYKSIPNYILSNPKDAIRIAIKHPSILFKIFH
ncbi:MAG: radical SAM protein [Candidatus Methanoperedens sp.]